MTAEDARISAHGPDERLSARSAEEAESGTPGPNCANDTTTTRSTTMTIAPDRLSLLDQINLDHGSHDSFDKGHCAMEVVAWLANEGHTDAPACASPVLRRYVIALNDRWDDEKRQALKPFLPRMVGTASDGKDELREQIAARYVAGLLGPWLRLAGLDEQAAAIESGGDLEQVRRAVRAARNAAWALRSAKRAELRKVVETTVRERLAEQGKPAADAVAVAVAVADAVADAVAVADADAVAVAVADADAVAVAVAVAVADAVAVAVAVAAADAVAVADAVADAVAVAVAVAAADAVAVAVADADAVAAADADGLDWWGKPYSAAYKAARAYYDANPLPIGAQVAEIAASQDGAALELLEKMIDPQVA